VRVLFNDAALGSVCSRRQAVAERWGDSAAAVELALCTLRASRDLRGFLAMPNVTQEDDDLIFKSENAAVCLTMIEVTRDRGKPCVAVEAVRVRDVEVG
jgi:hypothetical protein